MPPLRSPRIYANEGTWDGILQKESGIPQRCVRTFVTGENFYIGGVDISPFHIPHDANDPVGFSLNAQGLKCGVATDIGHVTDEWMDAVSGCQALVLEANHDVEMVQRGPYPLKLKRRILSRKGTSTTRTVRTRCANWRRGAQKPSFFLIFLLTIIYRNWHIIRYAVALSAADLTSAAIFASAFPEGTRFLTCWFCARTKPTPCKQNSTSRTGRAVYAPNDHHGNPTGNL